MKTYFMPYDYNMIHSELIEIAGDDSIDRDDLLTALNQFIEPKISMSLINNFIIIGFLIALMVLITKIIQ